VPDRLEAVLKEAAFGRPPAADGVVEVVPVAPESAPAVVAFTAHHVIAADVDPDEVLRRLPAGDLGAPMSASFLLWLAGWVGGAPGVIDGVFATVGDGSGPGELEEQVEAPDHPRVARATSHRRDVRVWSVDGGLVIVGRGLVGRWEVAYEVDAEARNRGVGRRLAACARGLVPAGEPLFAQVSPGNAASVRSILAAGYRPIGAEVLFARTHAAP
jgi:hypothetical protein